MECQNRVDMFDNHQTMFVVHINMMDIITTSLNFHTIKESTTQCSLCQSCTLFNQFDILLMNKISKACYSKAQYKTIPYCKLRLGNQFFM